MASLAAGAEVSAGAAPLLAVRRVSKTFPGVRALDGVDFSLARGEIHALMGGNGAGKSTLIKVITGAERRDEGEILLEGRPLDPTSPGEAQRAGISTVYQEVNLVPTLSVAENVALGRLPRRFLRIDWRAARARAKAALARLELDVDVERPLGSFSLATQQMVAIARALEIDAKVLILDEPTSSLDEREVEHLFAVMRRLKGQGLGLVFVSHFLDQVYAIADRMTVLRNGRLVGAYDAAALPRLELVAHMLGKDIEEVRGLGAGRGPCARDATAAPVLVEARGLGRHGAVEHVDLEVRAGEVVGLAGLLGSGRTETARLLFGLDALERGQISIGGRPVHLASSRAAIRHGFAFCPEDRKAEGILPDLSLRENIVIALQARRGFHRPLSAARQQELAAHYIRALGIAAADAEVPVRTLSGGNQQKAILARWLAAEPRFLILDEPTRGIDVGAKAEIEKLVTRLCGDGLGLLFISSDLEEIARNAHRVVVLRDRRKVGELAGEAIDEASIVRAIAAEAAS